MSQAPASPTPSANSQVDQIVKSAIQEISHIATLPEVTLKIIRLVEDPESTAQDLNRVISNDPALGARILKVVNSAFYGLPGQIGSINRAIVLLGLNAVKNIAIAASLAKLFRGGKICPSFNARDLWTHSIAVATGTRLLAERVGLGLPDEAFLAGLIHDIGIMVEVQARRTQFVDAVEQVCNDNTGNLTFRQAEQHAIGATHEQFGSALCQLWKFPTSFVYVTGYHHDPMVLSEEHRTLAGLVHLADILAARQQLGFTHTIERTDFNPQLLQYLDITAGQVEEAEAELAQATQEANALLTESF